MYPFIAFLTTVLFTQIFQLNILHSAIIGVSFMLLTNTNQIKEALEMVEYKTIILIASFFAISKALTNTGIALYLAKLLEPAINDLHPLILLMVAFLIQSICSILITLWVSNQYNGLWCGGYRFRDFIKFGYLLTIIVMLTSFISAYLWYF